MKKNKEKMKRKIELDLEQAKELYKAQPELRELLLTTFTLFELKGLKTWEDLRTVSGYVVKDKHDEISETEMESPNYDYSGRPSWNPKYPSITYSHDIRIYQVSENKTDCNLCFKNIFATEKQAKSSLAMAQLSQLMKDLGDECVVDWTSTQVKYSIIRDRNQITANQNYDIYQFLAFKTSIVRDEFMKIHEKLIKEYFEL
jgi:hypothetical protein